MTTPLRRTPCAAIAIAIAAAILLPAPALAAGQMLDDVTIYSVGVFTSCSAISIELK